MKNLLNSSEVPMGLGMALAQNPDAMQAFAALPQSQRQHIIDGTHQVRSADEMRQYVAQLTNPPQIL